MKNWYAIYTKPRQESHAAEQLRRQAFDVFLPKTRQAYRFRGQMRERTEALFPRYLFIRLNLGTDNIAPIRSTRGVSKLVGFSGLPAVVPEALIDALIEATDTDTGLLRQWSDPFEEGSTVTIVDGPLAGLEAIFNAHDGEARSVILLELLGKTQRLVIETNHIWPAQAD